MLSRQESGGSSAPNGGQGGGGVGGEVATTHGGHTCEAAVSQAAARRNLRTRDTLGLVVTYVFVLKNTVLFFLAIQCETEGRGERKGSST